MDFKELSNGTKISAIGQGTWKMGGELSPDTAKDKEEIEALRAGIELGMTHIDTAEMYASGHAEEIVGEAIKPFDREKLFITTKVHPNNLRYNDVIAAIKRSLKRLQLKYVDLYLVHWPNPNIPLKETMEAMNFVAEQDWAKHIGVSNFSVKLLKEAQSHLEKLGSKHPIVANQVKYSLLHREPEDALLRYCQSNKIMLIAYTPLAKGKLAKQRFYLINQLAKKYNKTPAQISLNWLISKDWVVAIPKASKIEHVEDNAGAAGWKLVKEDIKKLDEEFS